MASTQKIIEMTTACCAEHLDEDYSRLCEKLIKKMGRKHDVPFKRGQLDIWASAVVYALGSINFLFDQSFEPYMSATQICNYFGTNKSTVSQKARRIKDMLGMGYFDPEFSTQHAESSNPMNDMVVVDGFFVPMDTLPEEAQKMVKDARAEGKNIELRTE